MKKTYSLVLFASLLAFTAPVIAQAQEAPATAASAEQQAKHDQAGENKKHPALKDAKKPVEDDAAKAKVEAEKAADARTSDAPVSDDAKTAAANNGTVDKAADVKQADPDAANEADKAAPEAKEKTAAAGTEKAKDPSMEVPEPPKQKWAHQGIFGKYDMASVQRGFQVYKEVCAACHSMKFMSYRDLSGLGYTPDQVKAVAAEATITDGPNDDGEMFERPGRPSDQFKSPFPNDKAARAANGGALPPDMSLLVKAREHGEDYIYAVLTGYTDPPAGVTLNPGKQWNKYFPPHQISMPKPLTDGQVSFSDNAPNALPDEARDIVQFLAYASEPHMEARKFMGIKVVLFLLVFAGIMRAVKRKVWAGVH